MKFDRHKTLLGRKRGFSHQPVFVFGCSHRCGSTLLQRLLNSVPQILIWGEHNGYLNDFFWNYGNLLKWSMQHNDERLLFFKSGYDNFLPNMFPDQETIREAGYTYLISLFALPAMSLGRRVWGFKEVRYGAEVALGLQEFFPEMRVIHLIRHPVDIYLSMKSWEDDDPGWDRNLTKRSMSNWARINRSFLESKREINHLLQVKFEDMIATPEGFTWQLAEFLEIPQESFNRDVFSRKLARYGETEKLPRRSKPAISDLTERDKNLLAASEIHALAAAYGYAIDF